jgi:syntaxin 12/13
MASANYQNYTGSSNNFEQLNSNISSSIYRIRQNVNQFTHLGKQIGTSKDNDQLRNNIHKIFQTTNELIQQSSTNLKRLASLKNNSTDLAFDKTKRAFEEEIGTYSRMQKEVSEKLRKIVPASANPFSEGNYDEEANESASLLKQKKIQDLDQRHALVRDRETKVKQIESDILDINAIMIDLAGMVNEQTSLIDHITTNVEQTFTNVDNANDQLDQANRYASKYRKKVLILIVIILLVLGVVGLILYLTLKKK